MNKKFVIALGLIFLALSLSGFGKTVVRVGAFPNITHAQAMVGKANGWFDKALGPARTFNGQVSTLARPLLKPCFPGPSL
jgi:ABC-type nitrate/sulfonate/bicarbonate transport system substrate-binding protein